MSFYFIYISCDISFAFSIEAFYSVFFFSVWNFDQLIDFNDMSTRLRLFYA